MLITIEKKEIKCTNKTSRERIQRMQIASNKERWWRRRMWTIFARLICFLSNIHLLTNECDIRVQFHQPYGAKCKCASRHSLAPAVAIQFHKQNDAQLYHCAQLENTLNFYAVRPTPCDSKIGVNPLAQELFVKCWWNWHLFVKVIEYHW